MNADRWQKIDQLLDAALELPPEQRAMFLSEVCADDEEIRREVESLLEAHEQSGSFIESTPGVGLAALVGQSSEPAAAHLVGHTLAHYQIIELLGAGGMGEVYRARDTRLERKVAIKVLPRHLAAHPDALSRFEREAKAVAALSHPNILAIHDFGHEGGLTYAVMELLEGETLRQRLRSSALSWREAVKITAAIADGLAAAHARGIIHRDIKPENVFLTTDGLVKILDFGIARVKRSIISSADTLISHSASNPQVIEDTRPGTLMGTVGYMSPEQVRGESADATSDIFSLGCVLIEMLSGVRLFARQNMADTMAAILRDEPPLDTIKQDIPPELERIVYRCLEKMPDERFQSARDLAFDLRSLLSSASGTYKPVSAFTQPQQTTLHPVRANSLQHGVAYGVLFFTLIAALGITGYHWWKSSLADQPPANSLAVLPLANDSDDKNLEFLSDGISESIVTNLSPLRPKLLVLASSSVSGYKSRTIDPRQVGRELKVRHVLVGRVLQQDDSLVIRVELVDTTDGTQLWSARYQKQRADLLAVQEDISQQISTNLQLNLTGEEKRLLAKRYTANSEAHYLYLNGRYFWNQRTDKNYEKAIGFYERAIALDPNYALAYAGMADAYALLYDGGPIRDQARGKAEQYARKAISLDGQLAEPYSTLGFLAVFRDQNWTEAEKNFKRAKELNSGYETAYHWHAIMLAILGRFEEALDEIERAREIAPRSFPINKDFGEILYQARRYDEAIAQFRRTIDTEPNNDNVVMAQFWVRNCYEQKADLESAIKQLALTGTAPQVIDELRQASQQGGKDGYWQKRLEMQARRSDLDSPNGRMRMVFANAAAGHIELALSLLKRSIEEDHHDGPVYLKVDPRFDNLRTHPRFNEFLKRLNLAN